MDSEFELIPENSKVIEVHQLKIFTNQINGFLA